MPQNTPFHAIPLIAAGQAQKHVTVNDALVTLDALVHISVISARTAAPPSPVASDRYLVAENATGSWAGKAGQIATFDEGAWRFRAAHAGLSIYNRETGALLTFDGSEWASPMSLNPASLVGVGTAADSTNRLAVASPASLFTDAGDGDHRLKINKAAAGNTASILFQTAYAGKAEIGLAGDDGLHFKVHASNGSWRDALVVDPASAKVAMPWTALDNNLLINGDFQINQRGFSGGALASGAYGFDRWRASSAGTSLQLSGKTLTLAAGSIAQTVEETDGPFAQLVFSCEDIAGAPLRVTINGVSIDMPPGAGRHSAVFDFSNAPLASAVAVVLSAPSGAVSFRLAKLEHGTTATQWHARPTALEHLLCRRYFQVHRGGITMMSWAGGTAGGYSTLATPMRVAPVGSLAGNATITMFNVGVSQMTPQSQWNISVFDEASFSIAFNADSPATMGQQIGFLHNAVLHFNADY